MDDTLKAININDFFGGSFTLMKNEEECKYLTQREQMELQCSTGYSYNSLSAAYSI